MVWSVSTEVQKIVKYVLVKGVKVFPGYMKNISPALSNVVPQLSLNKRDFFSLCNPFFSIASNASFISTDGENPPIP